MTGFSAGSRSSPSRTSSGSPGRYGHPAEFLSAIEPLWVAALGIQFILGGGLLLARLIQLLGRGGAVETVEWATYMSMLFVFPLAVAAIGWWLPRLAGNRIASGIRRALVLLVVVEFGVYALFRGSPSLVITAIWAAVMTVVLLRVRDPATSRVVAAAVAVCCSLAAWMAAGALVSWQNPVEWYVGTTLTLAVVFACVVIMTVVLRRWAGEETPQSTALPLIELLPLGILVAFSFRTFPMVEFYHWGFFVGPIEQLRQGGTLLWDTPSQYGFLSILLPSLLPGNAWQSFWFFQSVAYALVACLMYLSMRRLSPGWLGSVASLVVTFTTLFFRPRTESLLLPAQMTPAAGPFRFVWCFVMLAFLVRSVGSKPRGTRFVLVGTLIWTLALLWSAETAIYVTAMWFPALLIFSIQSASAKGLGLFAKAVAALRTFLVPFAAAALATVMVVIGYRLAGAPGPDFLGHFEYVLLYSRGGFGALPINPTGSIWYLVLSFLIVVTMLVIHLRRNPGDPRLIVWAASSGLIWAVSSYFTGRSHPVNLIALVPVLLYTLVAAMRMRPFETSLRARYAVAAAMVPMMAMPAALAAGHRSFASAVAESQLSPRRFTSQVPLLDPELQSLLLAAGATPDDHFVLLSDGRLMVEAWKTPGQEPQTVANSWLPKAFEIIGSLPEARRQVYFERNSQQPFGRLSPAWLIESKRLKASGGDHLLRFVEANRVEQKRLESEKWIVRLLGPAARASN